MPTAEHTRSVERAAARPALTVVQFNSLSNFIEEMRYDAAHIRHSEIRWGTKTVTTLGVNSVIFEMLIAGYITERDDRPKLVELREPCGRIGGTRRAEDTAAQQLVSQVVGELQTAAGELDLNVRLGRLSTHPSPLMPLPLDLLRSLLPTITTPEGTTYAPWTDGWAIGLECRRTDGHRTLLYLNPSGEMDEGDGSVFTYLGTRGDPAEDSPQHAYDPFDMAKPLQWYTVRTDNGDRMWQAHGPDHAREQHEDAFAGEPGETILAILNPPAERGSLRRAPDGTARESLVREIKKALEGESNDAEHDALASTAEFFGIEWTSPDALSGS